MTNKGHSMTPSFMIRAFSVFFAIFLCGCTQTTWQTESYKSPEKINDIKSLLIVYRVVNEATGPDINLLKTSVSTRLENCGITAINKNIPISYAKNEVGLDKIDPITTIESQDPVLFIAETRKSTWIRDGESIGDIGRYYTAYLIESKSRNIVWKTDIYLTGSNGIRKLSSSERGSSLGKDIVDFMQKDDVIRGCRQ